MYGSVDNSRNDCINEKNLIIKNNTSYIAARDQIARHKNTTRLARANTILHVCDRMDQKVATRVPNLDSFRQE